jgi:hypothetical protein
MKYLAKNKYYKFVLLFTAFAINSLTAQTKNVKKAKKAFNEKDWSKYSELLKKEKVADSNSIGSSYLNYLNYSNDGPNSNPKKQLKYCQLFFNQLKAQELTIVSGYCEELKICVDNQADIIDSSITSYANWIINNNDTLEARIFLDIYSSHRLKFKILNLLYTEHYKDLIKKPEITRIRYYLEKFPESQFKEIVSNLYDSMMFQSANSDNTVISFKQYTEIFPKGKYRDSAQSMINKFDWLEIESSFNIDDFIQYRINHPNSAFLENAKNKEIELSWNYIKNMSSIEKIKEFINKYPNSKYQSEAKILEIKWAYDFAKNSNSIELLQDFRNQYKNSIYIDSSLRLEESIAFDIVKLKNKVEEFENYLVNYPSSKYNRSIDSLIFSYYLKITTGNYNIASLKEIYTKINHKKSSTYFSKYIKKLEDIDSLIYLNNNIVKGKNFLVPKNVTITPNNIVIKSSKPIIFKNVGDGGDGTFYDYLTYIPLLESHELLKSYDNPFLINEKTFKLTRLAGQIQEFFRVDSTVYFISRNECISEDCEGFEIYRKDKSEIRSVFKYVPDSLDLEVVIDSLFFENDKIYCSIVKNSYVFDLKIELGKSEFSLINNKWEKTNMIVPVEDKSDIFDKVEMLKLIETRRPFFTSQVSKNEISGRDGSYYSSLYAFDDYGELKRVSINEKLALYPIQFVDNETLKNFNVIEDFRKNRITFDLICTTEPKVGIDYSNINSYSRESLVFIKFDNSVLFKEIQNLPVEFNEDALEFHAFSYFTYSMQHPSTLTPINFCSLITDEYKFIDEFKRKKILESWAQIFSRTLIKNRTDYKKRYNNSYLDLTLFVKLNEYDMNEQSFTILTNYDQENNAYSRDFLNHLNYFRFAIFGFGNSTDYISNSGYSENFKLFVSEDKASKITDMLNGERRVYLKIRCKTREPDYSTNCNPCPNNKCNLYDLRQCEIKLDAFEYIFSASPNFSNSINVRQD